MSSAPQLALTSSPIWEIRYMHCSSFKKNNISNFENISKICLFPTDGSGVCTAAPGKRAAPEVSAAAVPPLHTED